MELHVVPNVNGKWDVIDVSGDENVSNHILDEICFCEPVKETYENGNILIVHNDDN